MSKEKIEYKKLLNNALKRLSNTFTSYLKVYLASALLFIGLFLTFAIVSIGFLLVAKAINLYLLYVLIIPLTIFFVFALVYLSAWTNLVTIDSIIHNPNLPIKDRFVAIRPRVVGFVWFNILSGLFIIGLLPFGIITLGGAYVFWAISSIFVGIIYLKDHKKGLSILWMSHNMVKSNFWQILLLFLGIHGCLFAIDALLFKSDHMISRITSWMLNLVVTPFIIATKYELYKSTEHHKSAEVPKNWLLLSKIGIMLVLVAIIIGVNLSWKNLPKTIENIQDQIDSSVAI